MIWKKTGQTKLDENKVIVGVEIWRCVGTLTGHSNDVLDLAWAPHDSCLASCSVDNTIIVWNMEKIPGKTLKHFNNLIIIYLIKHLLMFQNCIIM